MSKIDRKKVEEWVIREFEPNSRVSTPLTDEETNAAMQELVKVVNFPCLHRRYIDPPIPGQTFGLVTFIPAKDVKPNEKGFYGYIKLRGTFNYLSDCETQMDSIIRLTDSANSIHVCRVGVPVPLVTKGFAEEVIEVDLKETIEKDLSANVRKKDKDERKEIEDIKDRAELLKKDVAEPDEEDAYISRRITLSVLRFNLKSLKEKTKETGFLLNKCKSDLKSVIEQHPEWEKTYLDKYMAARRQVNIPDKSDQPSFMDFVNQPIDDPEEDEEIRKVTAESDAKADLDQSTQTESFDRQRHVHSSEERNAE